MKRPAISEQAKAFYLALGFEPSPLDPMTLMVTLGDVRANTWSAGRDIFEATYDPVL